MDGTANLEMKRAHIRIKLDNVGSGFVEINGIDISGVVCGVRLVSKVSDCPVVVLEIRAEQVDLYGDQIAAAIQMLTPDPPKPREHEWPEPNALRGSTHRLQDQVCKLCRQVQRVAAATCPGPLKS